MSSELTWKKAIENVLAASKMPLHYTAIAEQIIKNGYRRNLGATPAATVNAQISSSIKHDGEQSPYVRAEKGTFTLRSNSIANGAKVNIANEPEALELDEPYEIITSFGMFWRRDAIEWANSARLLGMQTSGATAVDFSKQIGIYLLYDGREVIYVGRATDRPLGKRLFEHTLDRFSARWDRFSWFGLLPVSEKGDLGELPESFSSQKLIPALEAILIEAVEPRQNRKRGDDFSAIEYIQRIDPSVEKKRLRSALDAALNG